MKGVTKMKKQSKILTLTLVLALIISAVVAVGIVASAEDSTPVLPTIKSKNLYYEENTSIAVQVEYAGTLADGASLGIIVWDSATYDGNTENAIHKSFKLEALNGAEFYLTQPIEAGNMSYPYVIAAAIDNGDGTYTVGEVEEYSLTKYAYDKLGEADTVVKTANLCHTLLAYAAAADGVITNSSAKLEVAYVSAVGGTVGNGYTTFGGVNGDTVILRADAKNRDGKYFSNWTDASGEIISTSRVCQVEIPVDAAAGAIVYTANYADSANYYVIDVDSLAVGEIAMSPTSGSLVDNTSKSGYKEMYPAKHYARTFGIMDNSIKLAGVYEAVEVVAEDETVSYTHSGLASHFEVIEHNGDRELSWWRDTEYNENGAITKQLFNPASIEIMNHISNSNILVANANAVELDLRYDQVYRAGVSNFITMYTRNADNSLTSTFRVNFRMNDDGTVWVYGEGGSAAKHYFISDTDSHTENDAKKYNFDEGQNITVGLIINRTTANVEVYLDGVLFGEIPVAKFDGNNASLALADSYIKYTVVGAVRDEDTVIAVDNIVYANK